MKFLSHIWYYAHTFTAYGYGFLMAVAVSACPLIGVFVIPLLRKNAKFGQLYKYFNSLMIALGASALFCDAVLHLIPEVCTEWNSPFITIIHTTLSVWVWGPNTKMHACLWSYLFYHNHISSCLLYIGIWSSQPWTLSWWALSWGGPFWRGAVAHMERLYNHPGHLLLLCCWDLPQHVEP